MNILVVDDKKLIRDIVGAMVFDSGHQAFCANGYVEALEVLSTTQIDLVLMDIEMPDMDGFELTRLIREKIPHWFPIIFLSSNDSEDCLAKGIDAGGDDYLTKPVKQVILSAKIRAMARIAEMQKELDEANQRLAKLSHMDELTQLANRRGMDEFLSNAWQVNQRQNSEMSVLMIDIDFFKKYNDNYGHQGGDDCLKKVAAVFKKAVNRASDGVFRYGGEEFTIVLPFTPVEGARFKAKEILLNLAEAAIPHGHSIISDYVTLSIGVSTTAYQASTPEMLLEQADKALYLAKEQGRNQYCIYQKN